MEALEPLTFSFEETSPIRCLDRDGTAWAVAQDIGDILGIKNARQNLKNFPEDEKGVCTIYTLGGPQEVLVVNEPGIYRLIFQSRRPEAEKFKRWVFHEVLPSIRETGMYGVATGVLEKNRFLLGQFNELRKASNRTRQRKDEAIATAKAYEGLVYDFLALTQGMYGAAYDLRHRFLAVCGELKILPGSVRYRMGGVDDGKLTEYTTTDGACVKTAAGTRQDRLPLPPSLRY